MPADSSKAQTKDPYTEAAEKDAPIQQKIEEVREIIKSTGITMLVTTTSDGTIHSRAMAPASKEAPFKFEFIYNKESGKHDEIAENAKANVTIYNSSTTDWISAAGKATLSDDRERIKELFSSLTSSWFGDLGDGVHDGSANDPRVQLIVVEPYEIRYWKQTQTMIGTLANVVTSAATGKTANPGLLRTITKEELQQAKL